MSERLEDMLKVLRDRLRTTHNVGVSRKDPLLMALTGTWTIVDEVLRDGQAAQQQALAKHKGELELLTSRWAKSAEVTGDLVAHRVKEASLTAVGQAVQTACDSARLQMQDVFARHERVLRLYAWTTAVAVVVCVVAAVAALVNL